LRSRRGSVHRRAAGRRSDGDAMFVALAGDEIDSTGAQGMTTRHSPKRQPSAATDAVEGHGLPCVTAARRNEFARSQQKRPKQRLVGREENGREKRRDESASAALRHRLVDRRVLSASVGFADHEGRIYRTVNQ
jgi:hypothetical protein